MNTHETMDKLRSLAISRSVLQSDELQRLYSEELHLTCRRTRSDAIIDCYCMMLYLFAWVLFPEHGYRAGIQMLALQLVCMGRATCGAIAQFTDAGLCKARKRFSSTILRRFWQETVLPKAYKEIKYMAGMLWNGFRVCAVDGTSLRLPNVPALWKSFETVAEPIPRLILCLLYDIRAQLPVNLSIGNIRRGERSLLVDMIPSISKDMLLLLDRGYPAYWLFYYLQKHSIHFIARTKQIKHRVVKILGNNDWLIEITLYKNTIHRFEKHIGKKSISMMPSSLTLRMIRVQIDGYRPRWLITSLSDNERYTYEDIAQLYCERWGIETYFRDFKHVLHVEKFHAHYVDGIYQEIYASMILTILVRNMINITARVMNIKPGCISFKKTYACLRANLQIVLRFDESHAVWKSVLRVLALGSQKKRPGRRRYINLKRAV